MIFHFFKIDKKIKLLMMKTDVKKFSINHFFPFLSTPWFVSHEPALKQLNKQFRETRNFSTLGIGSANGIFMLRIEQTLALLPYIYL